MGRKKKKVDAEGTEAAASGGRSMLLPALVVAVAVLAAGFMMKGGGGTPPAAAEPAPEKTEVAEGAVLETEPMTLNLADGHYLKVGLALQLAATEGGGGHGGGEEGPSPAKALDLAIAEFSGHTMKELSDPAKRAEVKAKLSKHVAEAYHGEVLGVYFTEFVMQ